MEARHDEALAQWMANVGGAYKEDDAIWACDTLAKDPASVPWSAVGDPRLIWAGRLLCTEYSAAGERAALGFRQGTVVVGDGGVQPGTYISRPGTKDCYWERVDANGTTIANDFVTFAPDGVVLTIYESDGGVKIEGCGPFTAA